MAVRDDKRKGWFVDFVFDYPDGTQERVRKRSPVQTKRGAEAYEHELRKEKLKRYLDPTQPRKEVPTFSEWWDGRFWREWVVARRNKPGEVESKKSIYEQYLKARFGDLRLDEIVEGGHIPDFRASLVELVDKKKIGIKRVNNILAPLSKALRYAEDQRVIAQAPKVGMFKVEPPEIVWWDFDQYPRILAASVEEGEIWRAAVCLAGEAGLRIGEVRALIWERDIDLVAGTITVSEQMRKGIKGTPKGRTRRTIPMTATLDKALRSLSMVRRGLVLRNSDGSPLTDGQTTHAIYRIDRRAGLPEEAWHSLRHSFGTHAALLGVNPWRLMSWMGHKSIVQTMRYVHVAEDHRRPIPEVVLEAGRAELDPDRRIIRMLGARSWHLYGTPGQQEDARSEGKLGG